MTRLTPGRVLIVDACPLLCDGLSSCVSRAEHVLIGQAPLADDAARMLATESVDIVIVGPHIAEHEAFNLCRRLESHTQLRTIVIVGPTTDLHVHADAAFIGITACLNYDITCVELLTVMAMVTSGYRLLSGAHDQVGTGLSSLTQRETQVLAALATEQSYSGIAASLGAKAATISNHAQHILEKLDVHDRASAVRCARRLGWL